MEEFVNLFLNSGVAIGVVIYFIWKDAKLTAQNTEMLSQVKNLLMLFETKFQIDINGDDKYEK